MNRLVLPLRRIALAALALGPLACGDGYIERPTQVTFDPASRDFWSLPMPSDLRLEEDGTFDFQRFPGKRPNIVSMWIKAADDRLRDGWGVTTGGFFTLGGAIDPASLPASPADTLGADAAVYLIDVDPASPERGRRFPLQVEFTAEGDVYSPPNLLAAYPAFGFVRRAHTTYAFVVTDRVRDLAGKPLGRSRAFHLALEKQAGADPGAAESFEPLRAQLSLEKRDRSKVVAATVFRTFDPSASLRKLGEWVETLPAPTLATAWQVAQSYQSFQVLTATYRVPAIQTGDRPGYGRIVWGADGFPVQQGTQEVRLALAVPKKPMPAGGFPLTLYLHGSGGEWYEPIDRGPRGETGPKAGLPEPAPGTGPAEWLGRRGVAVMSFDFPLHGNRKDPPDTTGLELYNLFGDIDSTIDNFQVAPMEVLYLSRLIPGLEIPASLTPTLDAGGAADGKLRFDPSRLSAMGHSMGSTIGIPVGSVSTRIKGFVFSGAGGMLIEVANSGLEPVELKPTLELLLDFPAGQGLRRGHPLLHLFQNLWDYTDPVAKAAHVAREPHEGQAPRPFLMTAGVRDGYFSPLAETAAAVALGATQVGAEVDPTTPDALRLDGRDTMPYPLQGNLNGVTAALVQYAAPFTLGHYVVFEQEGARQQYTCFLANVGTTATGPRISAATGLDAPCP
ncbi:MAG: hypothetical protein ACYC8T_18235 [Myxococcaceae bacterium]